MQCHPDRHPGDKQAEARFKELNEAYQTSVGRAEAGGLRPLRPCRLRAGRRGRHGRRLRRLDVRHFRRSVRRHDGRPARPPAPRGASAARTCATISRSRSKKRSTARPPRSRCRPRSTCEACAGSGARAGSKPATCRTCARPRPRARAAGLLRDRAHLPDLPGTRPDDRQPLRQMRGLRPRDAGADAVGQRSRRRRGRHAHPADRRGRGGHARRPDRRPLHLPLRQAASRVFQRDGADLYCRVPISMVQAALGGEFTVRTLDGTESRVSIPEGAQSGRQLRLRGKGMPILRSRDAGDLFVQLNVETPQNLTRRQRELLPEFAQESSTQDPSGKRRLLRQDERVLRGAQLTALPRALARDKPPAMTAARIALGARHARSEGRRQAARASATTPASSCRSCRRRT